ncbi:MAG: hypothetical protein K2J38_01205 [Muribaculaceae bacterium]|nr:hypothetical protein [Muribaculaceae bacterium]
MNIILEILGLFLLYILIKALWRGWQLWRQFRRMQRFVNDPFGEMNRQARNEDAGSGSPFGFSFSGFGTSRKRKQRRQEKKIPHGTGEYIEFTEVTLSAEELKQRYERQPENVRSEEQITDIKWVDIP